MPPIMRHALTPFVFFGLWVVIAAAGCLPDDPAKVGPAEQPPVDAAPAD